MNYVDGTRMIQVRQGIRRELSYHDGVLTYTAENVPDEQFEAEYRMGLTVLGQVRQTYPGSQWGTDGVGYAINRGRGLVQLHKSGIGPRNAAKALKGGW